MSDFERTPVDYIVPAAELIEMYVESALLQVSGGNIDSGLPGEEDGD